MGLGRLYLRGGPSGIWWFAIGIGGEKIRISTKMRGGVPGRPPREVELWRARKLAELGRSGQAGLKSDVVTVSDICDMLETRYEAEGRKCLVNARNRLKKIRASLGPWKANELKADRLLEYAVKRKQSGAAVATVNLELRLLARAYRVAIDAGRLLYAPKVPHLPGANIRRNHVPDAILDVIRANLPSELSDVVWFLRLSGWRLQEALRLEWRRVDFGEQVIRLETSKTGEPRVLSFRSYTDLRELLERRGAGRWSLHQQRSEGRCREPHHYGPHPTNRAASEPSLAETEHITPYVFTMSDGRTIPTSTLQYKYRAAAAKAGMPGATLHDLRRSMVRAMDRAGVPRSVAMSITGHKSEAVYRQYGLFDASMQDAALSNLKPDNTVEVFQKKSEGAT